MNQPVATVDVRTAHDLHAADSVVLLDVREPQEWEGGHAPGALHVPLGGLDPTWIGGEVVLVVCRSGNRSGRAAAMLVEAGLPVVTPDGDPGTVT